MGEISLVITQAVLDHMAKGNESESQIAMRNASPEIGSILTELRSSKRKKIVLGGHIPLIVGDSGAIWKAHNSEFVEGYDALYSILARRPGAEMRFICDLD